MTTRERILAAWEGSEVDHVPLTTWCLGLRAPAQLLWRNGDRDVRYWYSKRMEHLHTLPFRWDLEDDFRRVLAWRSVGVDDVLDISVPWSSDPRVTWADSRREPTGTSRYPVLVREYRTPKGVLRHEVRKTGEELGEGWVVQPDVVQLLEDFNIPRAERHLISGPEDVARVAHCYCPPDAAARSWFAQRMARVREFSVTNSVPVQAWAGFGMDAVVWFCGTEGAVMLALDHPREFGDLFEIITETDVARTDLAAAHPGVDIVVERGWYSSTSFWSPTLFDRFVLPHVRILASVAHRHGKRFGYVMTTGIETLGPRLAEAGVDVLYFIDPLDPAHHGLPLERIRDLLSSSMTLVGGLSSITLGTADSGVIEHDVRYALDVLGPTHRFILHPVDALFPDTPWESVEKMIEAWQRWR